MSAHDKASESSRELCDLLLELVSQRVMNTSRRDAVKCCSVGVKTRFAYAYHRRNGLRVYLYGKEADGPHLSGLATHELKVRQRQSMATAWARLSPYYLELDSQSEVHAAIPLLQYVATKVAGNNRKGPFLWPSEDTAREMMEGLRISVQVSRVERDPVARRKCIEIFGAVCAVCGFDFEQKYGSIGSGFIHVHHLNPLASAAGRRTVNPPVRLAPRLPELPRDAPPETSAVRD